MKLKAVLNEFIYECKIKHFTPRTIKSYYNGNNLLIQWLNDEKASIQHHRRTETSFSIDLLTKSSR